MYIHVHVYTCIYMAAAAAAAATARQKCVTADKIKRAHFSDTFLQFEKCQKCVTVVKNRAPTLFGHIFAIRKEPKVCN